MSTLWSFIGERRGGGSMSAWIIYTCHIFLSCRQVMPSCRQVMPSCHGHVEHVGPSVLLTGSMRMLFDVSSRRAMEKILALLMETTVALHMSCHSVKSKFMTVNTSDTEPFIINDITIL